ncbi:MAG: alpha/beta hydrolase-fold protein [Erysipelotrichaceae bacterium]
MIIKESVSIATRDDEVILHIYLPNDYETSGIAYQVLYMYDGHNLFDDHDATYGKSWGLADYLENHNIPIIIVGIECDHVGMNRICEYSPYSFTANYLGSINGYGTLFMDWLVNELKPYIDDNLRTLPDRLHTGIGGSSMGGLMAIYTISNYNETFSKAACLSSFLGEVIDQLLPDINHDLNRDTQIYLSWGSNEFKNKPRFVNGTAHNLRVANAFNLHHAQVYCNLVKNGEHRETCWEKEVPIFMEYLYGNKTR